MKDERVQSELRGQIIEIAAYLSVFDGGSSELIAYGCGHGILDIRLKAAAGKLARARFFGTRYMALPRQIHNVRLRVWGGANQRELRVPDNWQEFPTPDEVLSLEGTEGSFLIWARSMALTFESLVDTHFLDSLDRPLWDGGPKPFEI